MPACVCTPLPSPHLLYKGIHPFLPLDHLDLFSSNIAVTKQRMERVFGVQELSRNCFTHWLRIYGQNMRCEKGLTWAQQLNVSLSSLVLMTSSLSALWFLSGAPCAELLRWWKTLTAKNTTSSPVSSTMLSTDLQPA